MHSITQEQAEAIALTIVYDLQVRTKLRQESSARDFNKPEMTTLKCAWADLILKGLHVGDKEEEVS